jgi:protein-S-isoprenylcysteine O-methyltransferase Ste14
MNTVYFVVTLLIMLAGLLHILMTPRRYKKLTPDAIWFANAGCGLIVTGVLNLVLMNASNVPDWIEVTGQYSNVLVLLLFLFVVRVLPKPHIQFLTAMMFLEVLFGFLLL